MLDETTKMADIARMYDEKTLNTSEINRKLADRDGFFFNHSGLILPEDAGSELGPFSDEDELMEFLHEKEKDNARFAMRYLPAPDETSIGLDAGCGAGGSSLMLNEAFGTQMRGFTLSPEQANYGNDAAKSKGVDDKVKFAVADMCNLPSEDDTFDFVWALESTEHISDLNAMFREFRRVAKSDAPAVVVTVTSEGGPVKSAVDDIYITDLHTDEDYLAAARANGWHLTKRVDLTDMCIPYWEIRKGSENKTGKEEILLNSLIDRTIEYHLFAFDSQ